MNNVMDMVELKNQVKESAKEIYQELGAGYNESIYEEALAVELRQRNIPYEVERNTEIFYKGAKVGIHRLDFILESKLVVELKANVAITSSHVGQTSAYLKTLKLHHGLIVNFPYPDKDSPDFKDLVL